MYTVFGIIVYILEEKILPKQLLKISKATLDSLHNVSGETVEKIRQPPLGGPQVCEAFVFTAVSPVSCILCIAGSLGSGVSFVLAAPLPDSSGKALQGVPAQTFSGPKLCQNPVPSSAVPGVVCFLGCGRRSLPEALADCPGRLVAFLWPGLATMSVQTLLLGWLRWGRPSSLGALFFQFVGLLPPRWPEVCSAVWFEFAVC